MSGEDEREDGTMVTCHRCDKNMPENGKGWYTVRCEGCGTEWSFCPKCRSEVITVRWAGSECIYCPEDKEDDG